MNILIVSIDFPPQQGGISTYSHELSAALARQNHRTVVLAPGVIDHHQKNDSPPYILIRTPSIPIICIAALFFYLPWLLIRYRINVVLHTVWPSALISHFWSPLFPAPYFVSAHGSEIIDDTRTWRRRIKYMLSPWRHKALRKARGIFPVSQYTLKLLQDYGIPANRIRVIPNGVDPSKFIPATNKHSGENKIFLTVARLDLHKGHDQVLKALAVLKADGITPCYWIAGTGDEEKRLRELVNVLNLETQVSFLGYVKDDQLPDLYRKADIFIMPSREIPGRGDLIEGFGIAFLEASACGLPVIAGRSGGVPDAVCDNKTGFLVDPDDPEDIARSMKRLVVDEPYAKTLGTAGRKRVESYMNWDCISRRMISAMQDLFR